MTLIQKALKLVWLPFALSSSYVYIYYQYSREALGYGCHNSLFNPYILGYSLNHKDVTHITFNTIGLWLFAMYTIHSYGNVATIIVYMISVVGAAASYYIECYFQHSDEEIIGASGGVYGLIGLTLVIVIMRLVNKSTLLESPQANIRHIMLGSVIETIQVLNISVILAVDVSTLLTNNNSGIAHSAHLGGFMCGVVLGCLIVSFDKCIFQG